MRYLRLTGVLPCILSVSCLLLAAPTMAGAAERFAFSREQQAITVSPVVVQRSADAGETVTADVTVQNQTDRPARFLASFLDVDAASSPTQDLRFAASGATERGAGEWMHTQEPRFNLDPGEERVVRVEVDVPAGAAPGGHYGALVVQTVPVGPGAITVQANVQVPFLLLVAGTFRHDLRVRIEAAHRFTMRGPLTWSVEFENRGNVHENLGGRLQVDPALGAPIGSGLRPMVLLPGATRRQVIRVSPRSAPNVMRASLRLEGDVKQRRAGTDSETVIYVPYWMLAVLAILAVLVGWRLYSGRLSDGGASFDPDGSDEEL